jgi:ATP-dependent Clp protease ATP-binding subunit ClpA
MRSYHIIIGSKSFFNDTIKNYQLRQEDSFLELVRRDDSYRKSEQYHKGIVSTKCMILRNDDYHGIVETAHDRLGELIKDLSSDVADIYIHNPPSLLKAQLERQADRNEIILYVETEKYEIKRDPKSFLENIEEIEKSIFGQHNAVLEISKSIWYLTNVQRKKPYVIMLYGKSSLGKTELVREIAKHFFSSKYMEKHLSMFRNVNYAGYMFGAEPNRSSIGYDLLERESNLVFLDELDKCPEAFYSAFYTLFDNEIFKDKTYDVDISGLLIILTSNFDTLSEMKKELGLPIFYRIEKFIHFEDFSVETTHQLVLKELDDREAEYRGFFTKDDLYKEVSPRINAEGENARTIKNKIQETIEQLMFLKVPN